MGCGKWWAGSFHEARAAGQGESPGARADTEFCEHLRFPMPCSGSGPMAPRARLRQCRRPYPMSDIPAPHDSPSDAGATKDGHLPLRILLVEDHADTLNAVIRLLERRGYEVLAARSFQHALALTDARGVDVLISDIALPDGDGWHLLARLQQLGPVTGIAMSGHGAREDLHRSAEAGFVCHLTKPFEPKRLLEVLEGIASGRRSGQS